MCHKTVLYSPNRRLLPVPSAQFCPFAPLNTQPLWLSETAPLFTPTPLCQNRRHLQGLPLLLTQLSALSQSVRSVLDANSSTQSLHPQSQIQSLRPPTARVSTMRSRPWGCIASGLVLPLRRSCRCMKTKSFRMQSCAQATGAASTTTPGQSPHPPCCTFTQDHVSLP